MHTLTHCTLAHLTSSQEQQSTKGADPQPEYYIDQIAQMTMVRHDEMRTI